MRVAIAVAKDANGLGVGVRGLLSFEQRFDF